MKRVLLTAAAAVLFLPLIGVAIGFFALQRLANADNLVRQLENQFNLRAEVMESHVSVGFPTRLEISGLTLARRDESVAQGIPVSERPPLQSVASFDFISLDLRTLPLLARKFVIENVSIERPSIEMEVFADGTTTFDELIKPVADAEPEKPESSKRDESAEGAGELGVVKASELPLPTILGTLSIEDANIVTKVAKSNTTVQISRCIVHLTDVDIDPRALADHNSANLEMSAWIGVDSVEKNTRYLDLSLDGSGAIQPFNMETGELDPSLSAQVTVRKDSWIDTLPLLDDMEELIKQLENFGVNLDSVRLRGDFSEDTSASFNAGRRFLKMTSDFMIPVDENFIVLQEGSWLNAGKNDHEFLVTFIASERLTRRAEDEVEKFLVAQMGNNMPVVAPVKTALFRSLKQDDFLVIRFSSKGDLGNPEVTALTPFGDVGNLLKVPDKTLEDLSQQADKLLKGLFGK
jgi:hypothetical protein